MAGGEKGQPDGEEDDKGRLQPALQNAVPLGPFPATQAAYLGDYGRERNRVEIKGGGQVSRNVEGIRLGREGIRMETEFGAYEGEVLDGFDRV